MTDEPAKPWWDKVEKRQREMAIALCEEASAGHDPGCLVCPQPHPYLARSPRGRLVVIDPSSLVPLWKVYLRLAEAALKKVRADGT